MNSDTTTNTDAANVPHSKSFCRFFPHIGRILMGLAFFVFGLNGVLMVFGGGGFIPQPKEMPQEIQNAMGGLMATGYMKVAFVTQLLVGVLLLINRFVPLALALIAPILVAILTFHLALQPSGIVPGAVLFVVELYLAWSYRGAFCPMLAASVIPGAK